MPTQRRAVISVRAIVALAAMAATAAFITLLPRLGLKTIDDGRAAVEVWGWNIAGESLGLLVPTFESQNPGTRIDIKVVGTQMQSRFLLAMASGRGSPDIMQLQEREGGKFTATGRLADLTPWASKYERDFPPAFWASCVSGGKVYALPWDIAPCAVFYKRWVFEKYGIDPDAIETWDDLIAAGTLMRERSGGAVRMMPLAPNGLGSFFQMVMQQAGGGVFDAEGRVMFDDARNRAALETIRRLLDSGICTAITTQPELNVAYNDENVACFPGPSWNLDFIRSSATSTAGRWGVFRLPALERGGLRNSNQGGSVLVIPAQSAEAEAASRFVEYAMCTVEGQLVQYEKKGLFPAFIPATRDARFDAPDAFFGGAHVARLLASDFDRVPVVHRTRDWNEAEQFINTALYAWVIERKDTAEWTRDTARRLATRLGRELAPR